MFLLANISSAEKNLAGLKHSSLFTLTVGEEEKQFRNVVTSSFPTDPLSTLSRRFAGSDVADADAVAAGRSSSFGSCGRKRFFAFLCEALRRPT